MTSRTKLIAGFAVFFVLAVGLALLYRERRLVAACQSVPFADEARYRAARDLTSQANNALSSRNYSIANDLFDMAAVKLGDTYRMAGAGEDDTGMALEAGRAESARGEFQLAARMKQSAMQSRLSMFYSRQHLSERCHDMLAKIGL